MENPLTYESAYADTTRLVFELPPGAGTDAALALAQDYPVTGEGQGVANAVEPAHAAISLRAV